MTTTEICPRCAGPMVRKPVRRGPRAGLEMWGCTRWPDCSGVVNIEPDASIEQSDTLAETVRAGKPGAYAQHKVERERQILAMKRRAMLPMTLAVTLIAMNAAFLATLQFGVAVAGLIGIVTGVALMFALFRLPAEALVWTKGVEGERKAAAYIEPLLDAGFVALYNRMIPGLQGDIDAIVIGPSGLFTIETKNWSGKVEVRGDRLFVGDANRSWVVAQVYREALAVQMTLGDELTAQRVTVTPLLCAIGGAKFGGGLVGGVQVVDGRHLARTISDRPRIFDDEQIQRLARLADQRLRMPLQWEATTPGQV